MMITVEKRGEFSVEPSLFLLDFYFITFSQ